MAYYDALIAAWHSATQPPAGVTGQGLQAGDTTAQKITKVNGWTVANQQKAIVTGSQILNCCVPADIVALTSAQVQIMTMYMLDQQIDASSGSLIRQALQSLFAGKTTTLNNLSALFAPFDNATWTWCQGNSYPFVSLTLGNLSVVDANNAGLV